MSWNCRPATTCSPCSGEWRETFSWRLHLERCASLCRCDRCCPIGTKKDCVSQDCSNSPPKVLVVVRPVRLGSGREGRPSQSRFLSFDFPDASAVSRIRSSACCTSLSSLLSTPHLTPVSTSPQDTYLSQTRCSSPLLSLPLSRSLASPQLHPPLPSRACTHATTALDSTTPPSSNTL